MNQKGENSGIVKQKNILTNKGKGIINQMRRRSEENIHSKKQSKQKKKETLVSETENFRPLAKGVSQKQDVFQPKSVYKPPKKRINSFFFHHFHSQKVVQTEEIVDPTFKQFINETQQSKGFKGSKTHSWNQLLYLTPQKRFKSQVQDLCQVKKQLYDMINPEKGQPPQKQKVETVKGRLIQFLTGYNPKTEKKSQNIDESSQKKKAMNSTSFSNYKWKAKNTLRQRLQNGRKKSHSQYQNKMAQYHLIFNEYTEKQK